MSHVRWDLEATSAFVLLSDTPVSLDSLVLLLALYIATSAPTNLISGSLELVPGTLSWWKSRAHQKAVQELILNTNKEDTTMVHVVQKHQKVCMDYAVYLSEDSQGEVFKPTVINSPTDRKEHVHPSREPKLLTLEASSQHCTFANR